MGNNSLFNKLTVLRWQTTCTSLRDITGKEVFTEGHKKKYNRESGNI